MALLAARGPQHPPPSQSERDRIRELSKYYCTFKEHDTHESSGRDAPVGDEQPGAAYLSPDVTLNALSQLGVYRFGCSRSFVSIIDEENQHLLAETTASISLRHSDQHLPNDGIYLGFRTLNLAWGVCPQTIKLFTAQDTSLEVDTPNITANTTRYIIRNFADEECFRNRPYVVGWPHMRFYAEVPLFSASGHVLGSYCVVDDKPRDVFGDQEVALLQEMADAIAQHLENARIVHFHRRAEKLVKGVTDFVSNSADPDGDSAESTATLSGLPVRNKSADDSDHDGAPSTQAVMDLGSSRTTEESLLTSRTDMSENTEITSLPSSLGQLMAMTPQQENPPATDDTDSRTSQAQSSVAISRRICSIFTRASAILRDSMDLAGVVFMDAYQSNSGIESIDGTPRPRDGESSQRSEKLCNTFGCAIRASSEADTSTNSSVTLTEVLLKKMIAAYPNGQIFDTSAEIQENQSAASQNLHDISSQLATQFPDAESVLFIPLWDWNKSRWLAGTLVWTVKPQRVLGLEELGFFRVFSNSIISEVARAEWDAAEKSKSDFISSISHELRSPLHGLLGSLELLQGTKLEPAQADMLKIIESCGLTLLDVLDHLLDFTKINNLRGGDNPKDTISKLSTNVDLGTLIEDVSGILYTSQTTGDKNKPQSEAEVFLSYANRSSNARDMDNLDVVVRIDTQNSWKVHSVAGAWRRIVMGLVGNSMKWTQQGVIEVSLSNVGADSDSDPLLARLSVMDTGSGISPDYLRHSVFSPFSQEDSLSEGVGLGLSLVHKLVTFLGGHIDIKSELGVGTQVDVYIPVHPVAMESPNISNKLAESHPATRVCLIGFQGYPDLEEIPTGILSTEAKRKLSIRSTINNVILAHPNWGITYAESAENFDGDFAIIEEATLQRMLQEEPSIPFHSKFRSLIVLGTRILIDRKKLKANFVRIPQPYDSRKIRDAIKSISTGPGPLESDQDPDTVQSPEVVQESQSPKGPDASNDTQRRSVSPPPAPRASEPPAGASEPPKTDQEGLHVLVVDDNNINLKLISTFARKLGCTYESAANGLVALDKYKESEKKFDYVLMDLSMPVMDGVTSSSKIREHEKENSLPPTCIMAITGVASAEMQQQAKSAGIDDYLVKPVSLRALKKVMNIT
ncbi:hypothetical protein PENANT_c001G11481 [Penicillium antarcticum]|uniref:Histidine kinase n=1 Tax=Penicillium antarcticum TaxID=416450 RepID=A0A1V6QN71_9EURO|nr:uncharacterized protein N7508_010812 [Penicillium antarcticum]KAJ5295991.1 hypothetical protein N7508_010812 [Penicillium antarcticum]OQD90392.1 hypothetical protein PENANT_c001G11481 [Penicillium antarcticum]